MIVAVRKHERREEGAPTSAAVSFRCDVSFQTLMNVPTTRLLVPGAGPLWMYQSFQRHLQLHMFALKVGVFLLFKAPIRAPQ